MRSQPTAVVASQSGSVLAEERVRSAQEGQSVHDEIDVNIAPVQQFLGVSVVARRPQVSKR